MRIRYFITTTILYLSASLPKEEELIPEISAKEFASPEEVHSYIQNKISDSEISHMLTMDLLTLFNKEYKQIVGRKRDFFSYFFQIFEDVQYISANYTENQHIQIPLAKGMYHFDAYSIIRKVLIMREGKSQAAIHEFYIVMNPYTWTIHNISHHSPEFYELNREDNVHLNLIEWFWGQYRHDISQQDILSYQAQHSFLNEIVRSQTFKLTTKDVSIYYLNNTQFIKAIGTWKISRIPLPSTVIYACVLGTSLFSMGCFYIFLLNYWRKNRRFPGVIPEEQEVQLREFPSMEKQKSLEWSEVQQDEEN